LSDRKAICIKLFNLVDWQEGSSAIRPCGLPCHSALKQIENLRRESDVLRFPSWKIQISRFVAVNEQRRPVIDIPPLDEAFVDYIGFHNPPV
jgi:hypothetical protein